MVDKKNLIFEILWISHTAQSRRNRFRNPNLAKKPTFSVWKENIWLQKTGNNIVRFKIIESNFFHLILSKLSEYWSYWLSWQSCPNNSIPNKSEKVKLKFRKTQYFFSDTMTSFLSYLLRLVEMNFEID